jgi:hypothetical protein
MHLPEEKAPALIRDSKGMERAAGNLLAFEFQKAIRQSGESGSQVCAS